MMASIFLLLLAASLLAIFSKAKWAIGFLTLTLLLATLWFIHHATSPLNIVL
ncbi:MAG: hypothetical protein K0U59_01395 [Gammaproteobacteria bacterium]|nr:hypothetical protein [Gammaproteobacteria bacterium]